METKICIKCRLLLDLSNFNHRSDRENQYVSYCKKCFSIYRSQYYINNKNKEKHNQRQWAKNNKDLVVAKNERFNKLNPNWRATYQNKYNKKRKTEDLNFKIATILRSRLNKALNGNYKTGSAVRDLGCSIDFLKSYLESKFQPGMTWDNWTIDGWHIDHIKPMDAFDLSNPEQQREACHYTNLQPLWAKDNLAKGPKYV